MCRLCQIMRDMFNVHSNITAIGKQLDLNATRGHEPRGHSLQKAASQGFTVCVGRGCALVKL